MLQGKKQRRRRKNRALRAAIDGRSEGKAKEQLSVLLMSIFIKEKEEGGLMLESETGFGGRRYYYC